MPPTPTPAPEYLLGDHLLQHEQGPLAGTLLGVVVKLIPLGLGNFLQGNIGSKVSLLDGQNASPVKEGQDWGAV